MATATIRNPGEMLQEIMNEYALSQRGVAKRLGVTSRSINEIVHGQRRITRR